MYIIYQMMLSSGRNLYCLYNKQTKTYWNEDDSVWQTSNHCCFNTDLNYIISNMIKRCQLETGGEISIKFTEL